jgi:ribosomal protein S18 acetylase RimI-like enzyme
VAVNDKVLAVTQEMDNVVNIKVEDKDNMITVLDNTDPEVAKQIYNIFQNSYKIEAQLIGVLNFPPLSRSIKDIENSRTKFYGYSEGQCLTAVLEIALEDKCLGIDSLTVDPDHFRKGIANKLINYVLSVNDFLEATVETAVVNIPAIKLYKKHGFVEFKRWTPSHGIEKLAMSIGLNA